MLNYLKTESNLTLTENGAVTYAGSGSYCLDLFSTIGALRSADDSEITERFRLAFAENPDIALKILFFARDIRGGLGERRVFRTIISSLAETAPDVLRRNLQLIPEYGRFDDLLCLLGTALEDCTIGIIGKQLEADIASTGEVSLLAKWLPSVNASNKETVRNARIIAERLGMSEAQYRRTLSELRRRIRIIENNLRERDYTFDYSKQPSRAMFKYREAFCRNDKERYAEFLKSVSRGEAAMHTGTLMPYDVIAPCFENNSLRMSWWGGDVSVNLSAEQRSSMDVTWNALEDFAGDENALVVVDGSGSMYGGGVPRPIQVAVSLGIYFAERCRGAFRNHFITFSERPQLVEITGADIAEKVSSCLRYNEVANTNLQRVFELILNTAVKYGVPRSELPSRLFIITDMEFDCCTENAGLTNFMYAKQLFEKHGYRLPEVVFWNVQSRTRQQPVTQNEQGVTLVSGCTPRLFSMVSEGLSPYQFMLDTVSSERYAAVTA